MKQLFSIVFVLSVLGFTSSGKTDPGAFSLAGYTNTGQVSFLCSFPLPAFLNEFKSFSVLSWFLINSFPPCNNNNNTIILFIFFLSLASLCNCFLLLLTLSYIHLTFLYITCISFHSALNLNLPSSRELCPLFVSLTDISPTHLCCCPMLWSSPVAAADQSL